MFYLSKIDIEKNTARAKHIRSLIQANNNIQSPLKFLFYNQIDWLANIVFYQSNL